MAHRITAALSSSLRSLLFPTHLGARSLAPVCTVLGLALLVGLPASWWNSRSQALEQRSQTAEAMASSISLGIDGLEHEGWIKQFKSQREIADWSGAPQPMRALQAGLGRAVEAGSVGAVITTLRIRPEAEARVYSSPGSPMADALERMLTTAPTSKWREATAYLPAMELALLQAQASTASLESGNAGRSLFAWSPVMDGFGKVAAIVQVEVPMEETLAALYRSFVILGGSLCFLLGGAVFLGARRGARSARALAALGDIAKGGTVEEPYLADDVSVEVLQLVKALEARREHETETRSKLTLELAREHEKARSANEASKGHERFKLTLSRDFPNALRKLAGAVGRIDVQDLPSSDRTALRQAVLKTCDLARVLDQHRELGELRAGRMALHKETVMLESLVAESLTATRARAKAADVDLRVVLGGNLPEKVLADAEVLKRCLSTLAENAVQAVAHAGGGGVSLRVNLLEGSETADIRFELCDSAPGMTEAESKMLFEASPTIHGSHPRRDHNLDASMALARELLRLHGAEVSLETVPGAGTRLSFTISFLGKAQVSLPALVEENERRQQTDGTLDLQLGRR
ncbi:MAG: signal transduction histidine kinase [Planctomycetota bacterium]|jgi:signal transduction histidine kinase